MYSVVVTVLFGNQNAAFYGCYFPKIRMLHSVVFTLQISERCVLWHCEIKKNLPERSNEASKNCSWAEKEGEKMRQSPDCKCLTISVIAGGPKTLGVIFHNKRC